MLDKGKSYVEGYLDGCKDGEEMGRKVIDELKQFLYEEIIERRHYSASKSFEVVLEKINKIFEK